MDPRELYYMPRRVWETLRHEGRRALLQRIGRRLRGGQRQVFRDYQDWLAAFPAGTRGNAPAEGELVSVLVPVCDPQPRHLWELLRSLREQHYRSWEVCLADDASRDPEVRRLLEAAAREHRFQLVRHETRQGIAATTQAALAVARGELVALVDHDDLLPAEALAEVARAFATRPELDLLYTDEDKLDGRGRRHKPFFKPAYDPTLHLRWSYLGHLLVARRKLVQEVGGLDPAFDGAQDFDLGLRLAERARAIGHLPQVLYHWRASAGSAARSPAAKPWAQEAASRVLEAALTRRGIDARVSPGPFLGSFRLVPRLGPSLAEVSAVAPAGAGWLERLVGEVVACPAAARGRVLLFVGPSVGAPARPREALDALLAELSFPGVGLVSGKLVHGDRVVDLGSASEGGLRTYDPGYFNLAALPRSTREIGGALCGVERALFDELGAARDGIRGRVQALGLRTVVVPRACFPVDEEAPAPPALGAEDPWLNPNLRVAKPGLRLAPQPVRRPVRVSDPNGTLIHARPEV